MTFKLRETRLLFMEHPITKAAHILGSYSALARHLGVTKAAVHQWTNVDRETPLIHCFAIELATKGAVTRKDLRPDDWALIWPELKEVEHA